MSAENDRLCASHYPSAPPSSMCCNQRSRHPAFAATRGLSWLAVAVTFGRGPWVRTGAFATVSRGFALTRSLKRSFRQAI